MRKRLLIASVLLGSGLGTGVAALSSPQSSGADTSPIVQQVNHSTDELANHEARITNTENDVKDLQDKTGTAPSPANKPAPTINTPPAAQPVADAAPVSPPSITIVASAIVMGGQYDGYCHLTYSDSSTGYTKATLTTTTSGNSSSTGDNCQSFIGQVK